MHGQGGNGSGDTYKNPGISPMDTGNPGLTLDPASEAAMVASMNSFSQRTGMSQSDPNFLNAYYGYQAALTNANQSGDLFNKVIGTTIMGAATAGLGGELAAAAAPELGTVGGAAAGYGAAGAGTSALKAYGSGQDVWKAALVGGLTSALGGAAGAELQPATGALTDAGLPTPVANALVKGGIGAGTGALRAGLTGGNIGDAALTGGLAGGVGGALQGFGAPQVLSTGAGTIAGALAGKYLAPSAPVASTAPAAPAQAAATAPTAAAAPAVAPATATPAVIPPGQATPTPAPASSTTNIGSYPTSGLGYQPRTQVNPNITNYNTYGQGPEASFYAPTPGT